MAEETRLGDLQEAHKRLDMLLSAEFRKREAFEVKLQNQIKGMEATMQEQFGVVNGKLDHLSDILASFQQQLWKFSKGESISEKDAVLGEPAQRWVIEDSQIESPQFPMNRVQIEQIGFEETLEAAPQKPDYVGMLKPLPSEESSGKIAPPSISSNIKANNVFYRKEDELWIGLLGSEVLERNDGIGVSISAKNMKNETKCKFSQSPLNIVGAWSNKGFYVVLNTAGNCGLLTAGYSEIELGKNICTNSSHSTKLCLNESFVVIGIHVEKLVKEKIHICSTATCQVDSANSTTTNYLTYKLGSVDKRFTERFKKEAAEMNKRSLKYVLVFDKLKTEKRRNESKKVLWHEWIVVIKQKPICLRKHEEIIKGDYVVFYINGLIIDWKELSIDKHTSAERRLDFKATLVVPRSHHSDLFYTRKKSNKVKLCFLRVFIIGNWEELRLEYSSFVTNIVDSGNLPLHISCEVLQPSKSMKVTRKNLVKTLVKLFFEIAHDKEGYDKYRGAFSNNFMTGSGTREDPRISEKIVKQVSFSHGKSGDEITTLKDYVMRVKKGQNDINYTSGEGTKLVENSSFLEKLAKRDIKPSSWLIPLKQGDKLLASSRQRCLMSFFNVWFATCRLIPCSYQCLGVPLHLCLSNCPFFWMLIFNFNLGDTRRCFGYQRLLQICYLYRKDSLFGMVVLQDNITYSRSVAESRTADISCVVIYHHGVAALPHTSFLGSCRKCFGWHRARSRKYGGSDSHSRLNRGCISS